MNRAKGEHSGSRGDNCDDDEGFERRWRTRRSGIDALVEVREEVFVLGRVEVSKPHVTRRVEEENGATLRSKGEALSVLLASSPPLSWSWVVEVPSRVD